MAAQTMRTFFNSKIKILLLILIWTLIWRRRQYVHGIIMINAIDAVPMASLATQTGATTLRKNLHSLKSTSIAADADAAAAVRHNHMTVHNPAGLSPDNERVHDNDDDNDEVANDADVAMNVRQQYWQWLWLWPLPKDQLGGINKTLSNEPAVSDNVVRVDGIAANVKSTPMPPSAKLTQDLVSGGVSMSRNSEKGNPYSRFDSNDDNEDNDYDEYDSQKRSKRAFTHFSPIRLLHGKPNSLNESTILSTLNNNGKDNDKYERINKKFINNKNMDMDVDVDTLKTDKIVDKMAKEMRANNDDAHNDDDDEEDAMDMTAILVEQLIYEFAIKYKQMPRLTYFTCHRAAMKQRMYGGKSNNKNDNNDKAENGDGNGDAGVADTDAKADDDDDNVGEQSRRQQYRRVSLNMRTMKILKRMFATTSTSRAQAQSSAPAPAQAPGTKPAAMKASIAAIDSMQLPLPASSSPTPTKGVNGKNKNGNGNANGDDDAAMSSHSNTGNDISDTNATAANNNTNNSNNNSNYFNLTGVGENGERNEETRNRQQRRRQQHSETMPSVGAPTISPSATPTPTAFASSSSAPSCTLHSTSAPSKKSFLIKVMQIDQLINAECATCCRNGRQQQQQEQRQNRKQNNISGRLQHSPNITNRRKNIPNIDTGRRPNTTTNWLEAVLRPNRQHQIVVLDLSCGEASRKLIEMASNRGLFSSAFHWLLIEDYAFNRRAGNSDDDDDDVNSDNGNGNKKSTQNRNGSQQGQNDNDNGNNIKSNDCTSSSKDNNNKNNNENNKNNHKKARKKNWQKNQEQHQQRTTMAMAMSMTLSMAMTTTLRSSIDANAELSLNNNENVVTAGNGRAGDANRTPNVDYSSVDNVAAIRRAKADNITITNSKKIEHQKEDENEHNVDIDDIDINDDDDDGNSDDNDDDDNDMEIIEKFLEKINININTELILAKRVRRGQTFSNNSGRHDTNITNSTTTANTRAGINASYSSDKPLLQSKDYYRLYDVWNPGQHYGGQLNISEIGQFTFDDGLQIALEYQRSSTLLRRTDMKRARIRSVMVITNRNRTDTLEHYLTTFYDVHLDTMNRFQYQLLSFVRDMFNFSFAIATTNSWGYLRNGKFDGMIGAVVRKQADICGSPIFFRLERARVIDYTARTWETRTCFIFRHPRSARNDRIVFLQPFARNIWILLGVFGILTTTFLWLLQILERKYKNSDVKFKFPNQFGQANPKNAKKRMKAKPNTKSKSTKNPNSLPRSRKPKTMKGKSPKSSKCNNREKCKTSGTLSSKEYFYLLLESLVYYIGSICQQGLALSTSFVSGRCIVITSLLFSFAIFQFYSASVVGTLLMERPKTLRTIADLTRSSFEIGIEDIIYNRDFFRRTKDPDAMALYAKKMVNSIEEDDNNAKKSTNEEHGTKEKNNNHNNNNNTPTTKDPAQVYRNVLHSHETGAHSLPSARTNWFEPLQGLAKMQKGKFAFHVDVATAYKVIAEEFTERQICELTEIPLYPTQKTVGCVQKGSPLRKMITYGLRRAIESGLFDYHRKIWLSPKPRCVKRIHTEDLRVEMETMEPALLLLSFGFALGIICLCIEILYKRFSQH